MRRIRLLLLFWWPLTGLAADFEAGLGAYNRGDYERALREFRPLAEQGVAPAQTNLGVMYYFGLGVPEDYTKAIWWYRKAR